MSGDDYNKICTCAEFPSSPWQQYSINSNSTKPQRPPPEQSNWKFLKRSELRKVDVNHFLMKKILILFKVALCRLIDWLGQTWKIVRFYGETFLMWLMSPSIENIVVFPMDVFLTVIDHLPLSIKMNFSKFPSGEGRVSR